MSGILANFGRDGTPVNKQSLEAMARPVHYRGIDGISFWIEDCIGLGHLMLRTTPESFNENLPMIDESGRFAITADARIDNRGELIAALDIEKRPTQLISDSELILAAYKKWGNQCPSRLEGDFAFCVWDETLRELFSARDASGDRPFYYWLSAHQFACASEIGPLLALDQIPKRLNEVMVADYLIGMLDDQAITFYDGIFRLPPGHSMRVTSSGFFISRYWSLDPLREIRLESQQEYARHFRHIFRESVDVRTRSAFPVISSLSGGLDSSSVTCVARDLMREKGTGKPFTISMTYDELPQCDEREYIHSIVATGGFEANLYVRSDLARYSAEFSYSPGQCDEPFDIPAPQAEAMVRSVVETGARVCFDGVDGDSTVSHGYCRLAGLFGSAKWLTLAREVSGLSRRTGCSRFGVLWSHGIRPLTPASVRRVWRGLTGRREQPWGTRYLIRPEFARRIGLKERFHQLQGHRLQPFGDPRTHHWDSLTWGGLTRNMEFLNKVASRFSVELRHPFRDRRLLEYCLALPADQKMDSGWDRIVLRRAMKGIVPEKVRWRKNKTDFTPGNNYGLLMLDRNLWHDAVEKNVSLVSDYMDPRVFFTEVERFLADPENVNPSPVVVSATLALWLGGSGLSP